ncbi:MAG: hypothetical protein GXY08_07740 [Ruminococcus sp.]|nr:hypothetical protein [Ruminococcus sp.]
MAKSKTLFNTSENSNFILNMTEETYSKLASWGLFAACLTVPLFTIFPEINDRHSYNLSTIGLTISGVYCLIMALIAIVKKYVKKSTLLPVLAFSFLIGWSVISLMDSYDRNIGLKGYPQRGEGLLSTMYYFGFFVTGLSLKRDKALKTVICGILASGWLNSLFAMIQIIHPDHEPSHYRFISVFFMFAASGLAHSPMFLGILLALCLTAALTIAVTCSSNKIRIFCIISSALFAFVSMFTFNSLAVMGLIFAGFACLAALIIKKAPAVRALIVIVPAAAVFASYMTINHTTLSFHDYGFKDAAILWSGDGYQRIGASGLYDSRVVDIENNDEVYSHITKKTVDILKKYPATGTGPEQLVYPQIYTVRTVLGLKLDNMDDIIMMNLGVFDKCYNEYLYIGATRGVPSMIALIVLVLSAVIAGFVVMKKRRTPESICLFFVALGGGLAFIICCSSIAYAPIVWLALGAACADIDKVHENVKSTAGNSVKKTPEKKQKDGEKKANDAEKPTEKTEIKTKKPAADTAKKSGGKNGKKSPAKKSSKKK